MFKTFLAGALSFLVAVFTAMLNTKLEWSSSLLFASFCFGVTFAVSNLIFKIFGEKSKTSQLYLSLFAAGVSFIFALLDNV